MGSQKSSACCQAQTCLSAFTVCVFSYFAFRISGQLKQSYLMALFLSSLHVIPSLFSPTHFLTTFCLLLHQIVSEFIQTSLLLLCCILIQSHPLACLYPIHLFFFFSQNSFMYNIPLIIIIFFFVFPPSLLTEPKSTSVNVWLRGEGGVHKICQVKKGF